MEILFDIPTKETNFLGEDQFFFSVNLSETESIAFDHTFVGKRVIKQKLVGKVEPKEEPTSVWESVKIVDGKLVDKYRVEWIDKRKEGKAIVNGSVWKTVWEKPLPENIKERLMVFWNRIYEHKDNLEKLGGLFKELDVYMEKIIKDYI